MATRAEPTPPPFKVGDRVRYIGRNSFSYGGNPMVEPGDEGRVTENHEGSWGRPDLGSELAAADDGWSTVEIKGNQMAVDLSSTDRYVRTDGKPTPYRCRICDSTDPSEHDADAHAEEGYW